MALSGSLSAVTASDGTFSAAGAAAWLTVKDRTVTLSGVASEAQGGTGISALGTGVATALGLNVGSAGAPVVQNGALGTPSSGVLTNCTGMLYPVVSFAASNFNPADGLTYYQGSAAAAPNTTEGFHRIRFPVAGTIIAATIDVSVATVLGTTEQATIAFRLNATTDTNLTTAQQFNAANQGSTITGLSIAVATTDTAQIKMVMPTFVTNPTVVNVTVTFIIRT